MCQNITPDTRRSYKFIRDSQLQSQIFLWTKVGMYRLEMSKMDTKALIVDGLLAIKHCLL